MGVNNFIAFPKLGIHLNIGPVAFSIGTITVYWYGIIIATAIMVALTLATRQAKKFNIKEDDLVDMFLLALPVSVVFARLFFVVFTWDSFKNNLIGIFKIWEGGLAIYGAIIGAILSVYIYSRRKKIDMWALVDFACVYLPLAQAIGRWGNFTNQELYGRNTDLPWGMTGNRIQNFPDPGVDGSRLVHPTFLYESLLNIVIFIILLRLRKKNKVKGSVFASYLMMYSFVRFMMEFVRVDEFGVGAIRYNQVFAALVFIGALVWLVFLNKKAARAEEEAEPAGPSAYSEVLQKLEEEEVQEAEVDTAIEANETGEAGEIAENGEASSDAEKGETPENGTEASPEATEAANTAGDEVPTAVDNTADQAEEQNNENPEAIDETKQNKDEA